MKGLCVSTAQSQLTGELHWLELGQTNNVGSDWFQDSSVLLLQKPQPLTTNRIKFGCCIWAQVLKRCCLCLSQPSWWSIWKQFFFIYRANYSCPNSTYLLKLIITVGGKKAKGIPKHTLTERPKGLVKIFRLATLRKPGTLMKINTGFVKSTLGIAVKSYL